MEEGGISNMYIDNLMEKISSSFRGTFSIDKIPMFKEEKFSIIVNLSKENEKGTHFIGISVSENVVVYFDSYGLETIDLTIEKYLKKYGKNFFIQIFNYNIFSVLIVDSFVFRLYCA